MNRKPDIWVDCDGVLADFQSLYLRLLRQSGKDRTRADVTDYDFTRCVATREEDRAIWETIDATPGLVYNLGWVEGAHAGLRALREIGHVRCLTSPHLGPTWMHERARWLIERAGFRKDEIVFCSNKPLVHGDFLIEDHLETANAWQLHHPNSTAILLDAPYNQGATLGFRKFGWHEIAQSIAAYLD